MTLSDAKKAGRRASQEKRLADIREAMRDPVRMEALLTDLGRMAKKVRQEYDENLAAYQEERLALGEFLTAFLARSFPKKKHRLAFLEDYCEALAVEIAAEKEERGE